MHVDVQAGRRCQRDEHAAYRLLGAMIDLLDDTGTTTADLACLETNCAALAEALVGQLHSELRPPLAVMETTMSAEHRDVIRNEYARWAAIDTWRLINAADPCGT